MLRNSFTTRAGLAATITFSLVASGACKLEKDENGGRPVVASTPSTPVATQTPVQAPVTLTSSPRGGSGTPVKVEYGVAELAYREKRYGDAKEMFSGYVANRPDNPWGHYMLGLSSWKSGDLATAESAFTKSLELDPKHVKSMHNLTRVLLELDRAKDARPYVLAAIGIDSTSPEGYRLLGRVHATLKENDEAINAYRVALSHDPTDTWSMNNLGLILIQQKRFDEALPALARAVQLDSSTAAFQNNLGIALEHLGQYSLATNAYRGALKADGNYTKAVASLARVEFRKEDPATVPVDLAVLAGAFDRDVRTTPVVATSRKAPDGDDR